MRLIVFVYRFLSIKSGSQDISPLLALSSQCNKVDCRQCVNYILSKIFFLNIIKTLNMFTNLLIFFRTFSSFFSIFAG